MQASEAPAFIEELSSGNYCLKLSGEITSQTISDIKDAMIDNRDPDIALDLSQTQGLTQLEDNALTEWRGHLDYTGLNLTSVILPESVTQIGTRCFYGCRKLNSISAPGVTHIEDGAFTSCSALKEVEFAREMDYIGQLAFSSCNSLTELTVNARELKYDITANCMKLRTITIGPNVETISTSGAFAFGEFSNPTIIIDPENQYFKIEDGILYSADGSRILRCLPSAGKVNLTFDQEVTSIDENAFAYCKTLKTISLASVTTVSNSAFQSCTSLENVSIPLAQSIGDSGFAYCTKISSIDLPDSLSKIGFAAFEATNSLSSIFIPSSVSTIDSRAFYGWTAEQTIKCETASKPDGWVSSWIEGADAQVLWSQSNDN